MKWRLLCFVLCLTTIAEAAVSTRMRDISRVDGVRENSLVGYGIVVGLAGSGDSARNQATIQSVKNTLENFGIALNEKDLKTSNAAAVIVTAELSAFAQSGDRLDVHVSSLGDARSLTGGTLYLTPLKGSDDRIYALAQGSLTTGGYKFEQNQNVQQRNHPTVGVIPQGAIVEREVPQSFIDQQQVNLLLNQPDFVTVQSAVQAIKAHFPQHQVKAVHAGKISISPVHKDDAMALIAQVLQLEVQSASIARIVVNERTGTIVSGADVRIGDVVISHGGVRLEIQTRYQVSQPGAFAGARNPEVRTAVVPETDVKVQAEHEATYTSAGGTTLAELVTALKQLKLNTRDIISILQALKQSGALHAELIVQ